MIEAAVGIDIGGTNTKMALVDMAGLIHGHVSFPTDSHLPFTNFIDRVDAKMKELLSEFSEIQIQGVGVGAPNANPMTGMIQNPPNLKWGTVPLKAALEAKISRPVWIDNDANVAAMAEGIWGVAHHKKNFIVVTLGTGVGTGIIVDGRLLTGGNGIAGEGGHLVIIPNGRDCGCGGKGHLEAYASASGIEKTAFEMMGEKLSSKDLGQRFKSGDSRAKEVMDRTASYLGQGLALMVSILAPEVIVLAGGVSAVGRPFDQMVEKYMNEYVFPSFKNQTQVKFSQVSTENGAVLGAASLVFGN